MSPTVDRRQFLKSASTAAVASAVPSPLRAFLVPADPPPVPAAVRVAVLAEPGFPTIEAQPLDAATLDSALEGLATTELTVSGLDQLAPDSFDVLLNPYGSAFPKAAWPQMLGFLASGGNWVNVGGVPFGVPVRRAAGTWLAEVAQAAFHKELGITQAFAVNVADKKTYAASPESDWTATLGAGVSAETVYELYYRFTRERQIPEEDGSDGPREAELTPLLSLLDAAEHPVAVPIVRIDRLKGPFAGGRWVLANFKGTLSSSALRAMIEDAALGAQRFTARPSFACYRNGETPEITVTLRSSSSRRGGDSRCRIQVFDDRQRPIAATTVALHGAGLVTAATATLKSESAALEPGLYQVEATLEPADPAEGALLATTGFWMFDNALLAGGRPFTVDGHRLLRGGEPYLVTGTSYMASDVHRRFLLEPNPSVWDRDFAAIKRAGINMIRTGIWTGWKSYMPEVGTLDEGALRALDAFMLTARKHDMPVIFTFFAFLPETWGGTNPYLDPRALEAQETFVGLIASRYREMNDVVWDLINEPSFCSRERLWLTRPNYDSHEQAAWREWLRGRHPAASEDELRSRLAELWRALPDEALDLPQPDEFNDRNIFAGLRPLKAMAYRLFANDMFTRWARQLTTRLREAGSRRQLVTVGQDEGGTYERPSPMFYAPAVDFTANHTWWFNDDLLWDSVVTKTPGVPNLISETGVMFYEKIDGRAWRTEEDVRDLLERKLVIALASDTAGFIEWIWNTNPYMPSDNEAAIGLLRVDGSAKPELEVLSDIAAFAAQSLHDLGPREPDPTMMVIPHSHMFSVRNYATEATRRSVRAMHYHCRVTMSAVSEYALERLTHGPKLLVLPSARVFNQTAWRRLIALAEGGATLLVTGPIDFDEHWLNVPRLTRFGIHADLRPVSQAEDLRLDESTLRLSYRGEKMQRLEKSLVRGTAVSQVLTLPLGSGRLIWAPLPVELAEQVEPTVALYRYALAQAGVAPLFTVEDDDPGLLIYRAPYRDAVLYALVSEVDSLKTVRLRDNQTRTPVTLRLPAGRAAIVLIGRRDGRIIARYAGAALS